jgi:hypothetical protein
MSESDTAPRSIFRHVRRVLFLVVGGATLIAVLNREFDLGLPAQWLDGIAIGERCTVGLVWLRCSGVGSLVFILFGCMAAGIVGFFIFGFVIDFILLKRHRDEHQDARLHALTLYQYYAWMHRGRALGDDRLTLMLDLYRRLQISIYVLFGLSALAAIFGF